ncbi:MAG TPA: FecR family protein [Polyangiaceae bacterium]|nr:FecR family protein [Polyangiaceae bacterium]
MKAPWHRKAANGSSSPRASNGNPRHEGLGPSSGSKPELNALTRVLDEMRHAPEPALDWEALESRLMAEIARRSEHGTGVAGPERTGAERNDAERTAAERSRLAGARSSARSASAPRFPGWLWAPTFAAAIGAGLLWLRAHPLPHPPPRETAELRAEGDRVPFADSAAGAPKLTNSSRLDGDALQPGQELRSEAQALVVTHAGRATWRLLPHSRARLVERAGRIVLELTEGEVSARVVPSPEPGRFIVDAAGARVAVHGTVFNVRLNRDGSVVDVQEGVVSVTPRRAGASVVLLKAPAHGAFTPDGLARDEAPPAPSSPVLAVQPPRAPRKPSDTATSASSAAALDVPEELTISQVEAGVQPFVAAVEQCFRQNMEPSPALRVSARTTCTLAVNPEGQIEQVTFAPPLAPAVQSCVEEASRDVAFTASRHGIEVTRVLELSR